MDSGRMRGSPRSCSSDAVAGSCGLVGHLLLVVSSGLTARVASPPLHTQRREISADQIDVPAREITKNICALHWLKILPTPSAHEISCRSPLRQGSKCCRPRFVRCRSLPIRRHQW
ncbi:unnamed protein product [Vitrella brassicaformis CCMP3155]|uniref:Uncharacterized protein n=1 Tax=Vitrella brassicaformis (strain CCMP3155) TaxID=1169540 RepID=A0A0G4FT16_VITBC|nr:unnamed protein product [Vitrella brassicaformis CCMP3155]|eukprot:CEM17819.1 unnamed protein product [Vitrella brassicaformis CCMP3155]